MVLGVQEPQRPDTTMWVARLVGLVVALGGLAGAGLGLLIVTTSLGSGGQFALAVAGSSANPRWLGGGVLGGGLATLASGAYLLALSRWDGLSGSPTWFVVALVGPPLLAWGLGLALAARLGRLSRGGALVSALCVGPAIVIGLAFWVAFVLPAVLLPTLLVAPLLLTGRGAPPPGSPQAAGGLRLGYLALPLALIVGVAVAIYAAGVAVIAGAP